MLFGGMILDFIGVPVGYAIGLSPSALMQLRNLS